MKSRTRTHQAFLGQIRWTEPKPIVDTRTCYPFVFWTVANVHRCIRWCASSTKDAQQPPPGPAPCPSSSSTLACSSVLLGLVSVSHRRRRAPSCLFDHCRKHCSRSEETCVSASRNLLCISSTSCQTLEQSLLQSRGRQNLLHSPAGASCC